MTPPAPDLGAIRERWEREMTWVKNARLSLAAVQVEDVYTLLAAYDEREALLEMIREDAIRLIAAYDAQTARLAVVEAERDQARELVKYTLAERDQVRTERDKAQALVNTYRLKQQHQARILDPHIQRLVALEQAARIWVREHPPGHAGKYGGCAECEALGAVALALDARTGKPTDGE